MKSSQVKQSFENLSKYIGIFKSEVTANLEAYRTLAAGIKEEAKRYKDESGYIAAHLPALQEKARAKLEKERERLNTSLKVEQESLEQILFSAMTVPPLPSFVESLRFYHDFGLTPNRLEAQALLDASRGNALGIRALNHFLSETKSGFRISATPIEEFAEDLERIELLRSSFWTTLDHHAEAVELLKGTAVITIDRNGRTYQSTRDGVSILSETQAFDNAVRGLEKAQARWTEEVRPTIETDPAEQDEENEENKKLPYRVEADTSHEVEKALSSVNRQTKESADKSQAARSHYGV